MADALRMVMDNYPVTFDVVRPERYDRVQVVIRALICFVLGMLGVGFPWLFALLYLALPAFAAVLISSSGPERYLGEMGPRLTRALRWLAAVLAYMTFLTDRFPTGETMPVQLEIVPGGRPTLQGALARLFTSLPEAIVLAILGCVAGFVWLIALVFVLLSESYPESLFNFSRGLLRWQMRLLAYHASLVEHVPPFAFVTGPEPPAKTV